MPRGFWLMCLSVFCSAFGPILVRNSPVDGASTAFWRLAFLVLPTLLLARQSSQKIDGRKRWLAPMSWQDMGLGLLAGFLYGMDLVLWNAAILRTTIMEATILVLLYPLLVTIAGIWLLKQQVGWRLWLGCLICLSGIVLMSWHKAGGHSDMTGNLIAITAAFFYAGTFLITAHLTRRYPALTVTFWQSFGAAIASLPFAATDTRFLPADAPGWLYLMGYSAITLVSLITVNQALKTLPAALAAILAYGQPLFATLFAALLFKEIPAELSIIGGGAIILGLIIATRDKPQPRLKPATSVID